MADRNAYFYLNIEPDRTSLVLIPQVGSGRGFDCKEIEEYLEKKRIEYNRVELINILTGIREKKELKLNGILEQYEDESVNIQISIDKMKVIGRFYSPSNNGMLLTRDDIIKAMVSRGVKFGAREDVIQGFLSDREYCKDYELASAMLPEEGRNAEIIYYFNTDSSKKPRANDDGSVDFHQLDNIISINKDDLLAELIPAIKGKSGLNVCGVGLKPQNVENKMLKFGKNIRVNDDRTKIYSMVTGHVSLVSDTVNVSDIYDVKQDVDASTGDIVYEGSVNVNGNVRTGYKVCAKGDIIINGVVEGARIEAGGQIIVKLGIQGMSRAVLKSGGSLVTKFIESAEVISGGFVTSESILHSRVSAQGDITVNGKKGFLSGGEVRSATLIHAKTAGSTMGTPTILEVGVSPILVDEYRKMEKEIPLLESELQRSYQMVSLFAKKLERGEKLPQDKLIYLKTTINANKRIEEKIADYKLRMQTLQAEIGNYENGSIKIIDTIYPGCKLVISGVTQFVRDVTKHCRFVREGAEIKMTYY